MVLEVAQLILAPPRVRVRRVGLRGADERLPLDPCAGADLERIGRGIAGRPRDVHRAELVLDDAGRETLDGWVTMMQDWMAGILDWHILTGRYDEQAQRRQYTPGAFIDAARRAAPAGGRPAAATAPLAFGATGLGTSAARPLAWMRGSPEMSAARVPSRT